MKLEKLIKTQCGIEKLKKLKKNKTILGSLRLRIFVIFAAARDFNKK